MLAGLAGLLIGPDAAFRWTLYLLLSLWPVSVYVCARLFGARAPAAAAAAAMSPFLVSATGIGYEQNAYVWVGYGVWTQLWASFTLPLAWGFSWRAIREGRHWFAAVALVSLTIALHFETGYLALLPLLLWPLVCGRSIATGARRAATVAGGALLAAAWVIVPLIDQRPWAATNEALRGTALTNGYGAARVLGWLVSGQLLDHGRLPVVTAFAAIGLALAARPLAGGAGLARGRGRARRVPALVVRTGHVRVARRRDPGQHRHLLPPLHDGRPAGRAPARRKRRRVVRRKGLERGGTVRARPAPAAARGAPPPARLALDEPAHGTTADDGRSRRDARRARAGVARAARVRPPERHSHHGSAPRGRDPGRRGRPVDRARTGRRRRASLCGHAVELGSQLHGRSRSGVQVPREPRRRRGRLHASHRLTDDRSRKRLRRAQPDPTTNCSGSTT